MWLNWKCTKQWWLKEAFVEIITMLCRRRKHQRLVGVHLQDSTHLFGLGRPIGVRLGSGLGTVFLIRICETFFGLFSDSVLKKKKVKMKEIMTTLVNRNPFYFEYTLSIP